MSELLRMEHISKRFGDFYANKDISLTVNRGEVLTLLGENGAGKSTLMNILIGLYQPTEGKIFLNGKEVRIESPSQAVKLGIGMVHQHFMLVDELTVAENLVLGMEPLRRGLFDMEEAVRMTEEIAKKYNFEVDPRATVAECSVGVKQKIEIMKALLRGAEILILDEPTAVLTPQEVTELFVELKKLRDMGHTIVFISHKLNEVKELCDSFTILRRGRTVAVGNVAEYNEQELSNLMVGRDVSLEVEKSAPTGERHEVLRTEDLCYNGASGKPLLQHVSFSLYQGRILGVAGVEGNGQKELSEILTGLRPFHRGEITLEGESIKKKTVRQIRQMGISNISEDRMTYGCAPTMSVTDNIIADRYYSGQYSRGIRLNVKAIRRDVEDLVKTFDVVCPSSSSMAGMLSGGNIQKMIAAREFTSDARVIVANQPTRGIDVGSSEFIHRQLVRLSREQDAAVLLVSADLTELLQLSDSLIVMFGGEITAYFPDSSQVTDLMLGEYMLGVRRMSAEEIQEALQ